MIKSNSIVITIIISDNNAKENGNIMITMITKR